MKPVEHFHWCACVKVHSPIPSDAVIYIPAFARDRSFLNMWNSPQVKDGLATGMKGRITVVGRSSSVFQLK